MQPRPNKHTSMADSYLAAPYHKYDRSGLILHVFHHMYGGIECKRTSLVEEVFSYQLPQPLMLWKWKSF
jgi:hypothetical protein